LPRLLRLSVPHGPISEFSIVMLVDLVMVKQFPVVEVM
jgi:hypothetical protein